MSVASPRILALPSPYGRPLSEVCSLPYKSERRTRRDSWGYVLEHHPEHPAADKGWIQQHRLVAEHAIGRILKGNEVVHHEDGKKSHNRLGNLWLFPTQSEHLSHHRWREAAAFEGRARKALRGRTTLEAARELGVCHQTLRNRCP